jgi:hypothetical protein
MLDVQHCTNVDTWGNNTELALPVDEEKQYLNYANQEHQKV